MKFIIYELVDNDNPRIEYQYSYINKIFSKSLKNIDIIQDEHKSMESAVKEIEANKDKLKYKTLTILPIFDIDWEGEIRKL